MKKSWLVLPLCGALIAIFGRGNALAEEITLLLTGQTHSMIYTCSCPKEPDGGVSRRAGLIKELRSKDPNILVLDSGNFFAGGILDEYAQNPELDRRRNGINLKAMDIIGYDAVGIGDSEFSFGRQVMEEELDRVKIPLVSCNLVSEKVAPYVLKRVGKRQIGITGLISPFSAAKAGGLKIDPALDALKRTVLELKQKKTDIIVVLSNLGEKEDKALLKELPGMIDILVVGANRQQKEPATMVDSTLLLRPVWQGRKLVKATLVLQGEKITDSRVDELRLSDKVADDKQIQDILPRCFKDDNCRKAGMLGICRDPGAINASCQFIEPNKVGLLIVTPAVCRTCDTQRVIKMLKNQMPGLEVSYEYYPGEKAAELIRGLKLETLPAYLLDRSAEKEKDFDKLKVNLEENGGYYMIKPQAAGVGYFLNREKAADNLDVFISLYDPNTGKLLENIKEFNPRIHLLAGESKDGKLTAPQGQSEIEECLRTVCVQKYYPGYAWDYLSCRQKDIESSWWDDCLGILDSAAVKKCARGEEGRALLLENTALTKELKIMHGPAYLLDNQEVFSSVNVPSKEELRKIITAK
ncbi:MAG: hypothetical protein PHH68_04095 [Candidatus Omnitrophica bacterium]|jgi:hypothetical protein|nr:hypothetical protein [Candidatus Omnitrophota bacterium]MDD5079490.1 hypothetical protein [Candidatus Omnitrophota bacterium]